MEHIVFVEGERYSCLFTLKVGLVVNNDFDFSVGRIFPTADLELQRSAVEGKIVAEVILFKGRESRSNHKGENSLVQIVSFFCLYQRYIDEEIDITTERRFLYIHELAIVKILALAGRRTPISTDSIPVVAF